MIPQQKDDGRPPRVIKPKIGQPNRANQIEPLDQEQSPSSNLPQTSNAAQRPLINQKKKEENLPADVRLMKPIPLQLRADFGDLTSVIARDIYIDNPGVGYRWTYRDKACTSRSCGHASQIPSTF